MLGFTGGVMVAASFWSLLAPGIEMSPGEGFQKVVPAAIGFGLGALFIFALDKILPHIHINFKESEGIKTPWHKTTLLVLAITLHNIPEGLAVGVLFGGVAAGYPRHPLLEPWFWPWGLGFKISLKVLPCLCRFADKALAVSKVSGTVNYRLL